MKKYFLLLIVLVVSCQVEFTPKKKLYAPPPFECVQSKFDEVKFDTNSNQKEFYVITALKGLSSPVDEYSISFYGNNDALLTYQDGNIQKVRHLKHIDDEIFSAKDIVSTIAGPSGITSVSNQNVYFTAEPNWVDSKKMEFLKREAELGDGILRVPISQMPGRMRLFSGKINEDIISDINLTNISWELNDFDWEGHPAVSPNGKVIFFASTRNDTYKGVDLFFGLIDSDGNISNIKTLGSKINTECDELSPFVSYDGKRLYFSSMGHNSVGGYDIFYCEIKDEFWKFLDLKFLSEPINVGKPINTKYDELFPSSPDNPNDLLYYSSNQKGTQNFDMYVLHKHNRVKIELGTPKNVDVTSIKTEIKQESEIKIPEPLPLPVQEKKDSIFVKKKEFFNLVGDIIDDENKPIPDAEVKVKKQGEIAVDYETKADSQGKYELNLEKGFGYEVTAQDNNHFFESFYISKEESQSSDNLTKTFVLAKSYNLRINFPYNVYNKPYSFIIDNLGKETNKTWQQELNDLSFNIKKMINNIDKVILTGHTDLQGSQAYNFNLGLNRAKFVYSELIKRGISAEKLEVRSVGKLEPIEKNDEIDEDTYFKKLRRVNFEIIEKK